MIGDELDVPKIRWSDPGGRGTGKIGRVGALSATLFTSFWDATGSATDEKRWALTCSLPGWTTVKYKERWATPEEAQEHAQKILEAFVARLLGQHDESKESRDD